MRLVNARPNELAIAALNVRPADYVLELGCGPGHGLALLSAHASDGAIYGIDRSETMLRQARAANRTLIRSGRVHLCRSRFEDLPFADGSIDKVLAVNVAYFWHDAVRVLNETRRVLKPTGMLAVYVTDSASMRRWKFATGNTHRLFDRESLAFVLRRGGFDPGQVMIEPVGVTRRVSGLVATAFAGADHR